MKHLVWALLLVFVTAQAAQTEIRVLLPQDKSELFKIVKTVKGNCATASMANPRADAWRCTVRNEIHDPCFSHNGKTAICPESPWKLNMLKLTLRKPINATPNKDNLEAKRPWALELANGKRCVILTNATGSIAGMRIHYACSDDSDLVGNIDRSQKLWRVFYHANNDIALKRIPIVVAWY